MTNWATLSLCIYIVYKDVHVHLITQDSIQMKIKCQITLASKYRAFF